MEYPRDPNSWHAFTLEPSLYLIACRGSHACTSVVMWLATRDANAGVVSKRRQLAWKPSADWLRQGLFWAKAGYHRPWHIDKYGSCISALPYEPIGLTSSTSYIACRGTRIGLLPLCAGSKPTMVKESNTSTGFWGQPGLTGAAFDFRSKHSNHPLKSPTRTTTFFMSHPRDRRKGRTGQEKSFSE